MKIRLGTNTPPENYADGQILTAANLRELVTTLKAAINNNYDDLIKIIAGDNSIFVYDTVEALEEKGEELTVADDGVYGVVLDYSAVEQLEVDALKLYQFDGDLGEFVLLEDRLSFISIIDRLGEIEGFYEDTDVTLTQLLEDIQDYNEIVGTFDSRVESLETTSTSQGARITTAEGEIDSLQSADIALDGRLDTIEGDYLVSSDLNDYLTESDAAGTYQPIGSYALTSDLDKLVKNVAFDAYNQTTGEVSLTITFEDNTTAQTSLDLKLELIPISGQYNANTYSLDFTLDNGTKFSVPVSALLNLYYGDNAATPTIDAFVDGENKSRFRLNTTWIANTITTPLAGKLATNGDASATTATFTEAAQIGDLTSGDTLAVIFGKLKKLYNTLGTLAFTNNITVDDLPLGTVVDADYTHTDNNFTNELKTAYDDAVSKAHTHDNKSQLDAIVGTRDTISLSSADYDNYLATIGAIKAVFNLPAADWDGNASTLGYKSPDVNATPDTVVVRDSTGSAAIAYNNPDLIATTIVGALDELNIKKANVSDLSSNILLYPTDSVSDILGYYKMVTTLTDPDYDTTAVNIPTGTITTTGQLLARLVSAPGLFVGNPGVININTIGNIRKVGGNSNQFAEFYFEVYKRDAANNEVLIATSDTTGSINPPNANYYEFSASALLNNGLFIETDRIVIKYYANTTASGASYEFQFGGISPVRTLLPVPVSVIPIPSDANDILTDSSNFTGILSGADDTAQKAFETLDQHNHDGEYAPLVNDKIPADYLPSVALTDTFVVTNTTAMTGLVAQVGDIAIVTEISKTFVLAADPASTLANWKEILTPADGVQSVSGSGAINVTAGVNPTVSVASGFVVPTTSEKSNYDTAYSWGNHAVAGYANLVDGKVLYTQGGTGFNTLTGQEGKYLRVNETATGYEFSVVEGGGGGVVSNFIDGGSPTSSYGTDVIDGGSPTTVYS